MVNYNEFDVPYTRIIEHKHFDKTQRSDKTVITREYPKSYSAGCEPYYPVNDEKNNAIYAKYAELANKSNVLFGGRLAGYKYYDMDDTVAAVFELTDKL